MVTAWEWNYGKIQKSGIMDKVSYACTVVGLMAIGAMIFIL